MMKRFTLAKQKLVEALQGLVFSKRALARRALQKAEALEGKANEAERLDRLRNPSNYRGR